MLPDRELDDLLAEMVTSHQDLHFRVSELEKIELPESVRPECHLQLPQLRGYWPMSSVNESGNVYDLSGQGRILTNNGSTPFGVYNLLPYSDHTPGSSQYFSRIDEAGTSITGALTLGAWVRFDSLATGANQGIIGKWDSSGGINERSYIVYLDDATNALRFYISRLGTVATSLVVTSTVSVAVSTWYHVVGRFTPSTLLSIFVDGVATDLAVGVPASIFNSAVCAFEIGSYNVASQLLDGRVAQAFLCADDLDDAVIANIFRQTRDNFGK